MKLRVVNQPRKKNIKMDYTETYYECMYWNQVVQDKRSAASCCEYGTAPSGSITGGVLLD
jgi:hypothetical protein